MHFRYRQYRRFFGYFMVFFVSLISLSFGCAAGYYYDSPRNNSIPFFAAFSAMFFYGGELHNIPSVAESLPVFSESENDGNLESWEVTYYYDEETDTNVPVFYGETDSYDGTDAAMGSSLIRVDESSEKEPEKMSVLIYCTHTSESYDGTADDEGRGEVLSVAHHLADTLIDDYQIGAVVSDTVHDSPDWYQSYANSKNTSLQLIEQYPDADLIIDLHRDAGVSAENSVTKVDGKSAATLLLVVGSNVNLEHPHWEENWETAKSLGACIDDVNPSLLRGIRVQKGRYNQHLSTNAVLLEVGTDRNAYAEAEYSVELVAKAISQYIQNK